MTATVLTCDTHKTEPSWVGKAQPVGERGFRCALTHCPATDANRGAEGFFTVTLHQKSLIRMCKRLYLSVTAGMTLMSQYCVSSMMMTRGSLR